MDIQNMLDMKQKLVAAAAEGELQFLNGYQT